jgi:hypothetical protein
MRRWLLLVMVVLLPLRGWVGEAMAGEMLRQQFAVQQEHHAGVAAGAAHDCEHQDHGMEAGQDAQARPPAAEHCPTCAACQVCTSVALSTPVRPLAMAGFHHPPPMHVQRAFSSAEPVLAFKPPRD